MRLRPATYPSQASIDTVVAAPAGEAWVARGAAALERKSPQMRHALEPLLGKPVPGMERLAFAATRLDGVLPAWQVSQLALVGMWAVGPGMADCGTVMMLEIP